MSIRKPNGKATRTYQSWLDMRKRVRGYSRPEQYRDRGIKCCPQWNDYEVFLADMGECPLGLTLDRIDNDGDYTPTNCRWASYTVQSRNRRYSKLNQVAVDVIRYMYANGVSQGRLARAHNVSRQAIYRVVHHINWAERLNA